MLQGESSANIRSSSLRGSRCGSRLPNFPVGSILHISQEEDLPFQFRLYSQTKSIDQCVTIMHDSRFSNIIEFPMNTRLFFLLLLILSTTASAQWTRVSTNLLGAFQEDCCGFGCLHFKDGGLWAGRDELFFSGDSGSTWSKVFTPPTIITEVNF